MLGLATLIQAYRSLVLGILASGCAIALLFANRLGQQAPVHIVVSSFGTALAIGVTLGMLLLSRAAARIGVESSRSMRWIGLALLGGFLGARLGYALVNSSGGQFWRGSLDFEQGGLFGYGAYIGGLAGASLALPGSRQSLRNWLDSATPILLVCTALVRLGCYLQGCDFGRPLEPGAPRFLKILGTFPRWRQALDGSFRGAGAWQHHVASYGLFNRGNRVVANSPNSAVRSCVCVAFGSICCLSRQVEAFRRQRVLGGGDVVLRGKVFVRMAPGRS